MDIKIVGLGGIGSALSEFLGRFLNHSSEFTGTITLIDGKEYSEKNSTRQFFSRFGNKAQSKSTELSAKFKKLKVVDYSSYITSNNIHDVIKNGDMVFVCVDNHTTRKLVSEYADTLQDVIIISGGNDWIDGNVQIYSKKGGKKTHPSLLDYHPEIEVPTDKSPDAMSCEELEKSEPQLFFTNVTAALLMSWVFYRIFTTGNVPTECEIYFDISKLAINAVTRLIP